MLDEQRAGVALQALSDACGLGLILTDVDGRIVAVNRLLQAMTGWRAEQLVGRRCRRFFHCLDQNALGQYRSSCRGCTAANSDERVRRTLHTSSSQRLLVNARSSQLFAEDGRLLGLLCTVSDASGDGIDNKSAEFLSNVSHELRTPLSSLANSIELLSASYRTVPKKTIGHMLQVIHHSTLRLHSLVENLLTASSIQQGSFEVQPRPSDLAAVVAEAIAFVQPILESKRQHLSTQLADDVAMAPALIDPRRIVQVIVNLLSNASKYGPSDDDIALCVCRRGRYAVIAVSEHGPGIAPEEQRAIFQRFYRSRPQNGQRSSGVGLGLAMVKAIVTAHGGKFGVQSDVAAGATFWFTVPFAKNDEVLAREEGRHEDTDC